MVNWEKQTMLGTHSEYFSGLTKIGLVQWFLILEVQFHGVNDATIHIIYHKILYAAKPSSWALEKCGWM